MAWSKSTLINLLSTLINLKTLVGFKFGAGTPQKSDPALFPNAVNKSPASGKTSKRKLIKFQQPNARCFRKVVGSIAPY